MSYQVEFLDHDAFDALPYPDMETSLGVADPKTQRAFVRKTGIKAVDLFNAAHELEHLQEGHAGAHADHYRNGVYYKDDFMQTLSPALGAAKGNFGPLLSTVGSIFGAPQLGSLAGQTQKQPQQPQQPSVMGQFQNAPAPTPSTPNVVQASGASGGGSAAGGPNGGGGLGQIQNQLYGNYSGR